MTLGGDGCGSALDSSDVFTVVYFKPKPTELYASLLAQW